MRPAPVTFDTKFDAAAWLSAQATDVDRGTWAPPEAKVCGMRTLQGYADTWLAGRDLKPRTRALYQELLDDLILPGLGDALDRITPATVRNWHATLNADTRPDGRTPTACSDRLHDGRVG